ncbi:MAG TPA: metallophosphoesterase family protein [Burkholderiales bacterium]|nr:metallophosphoesterase family protein [Burkholderiales bacterium]
MARTGVLADIHGNREALLAALAALQARGVERLACLGDIVGYNADPDECATIVRERRALAIAGNHDLISIRRLGFDRCSNNAAYALRRTRRSIAAETAAYLEALPLYREIEPGVVLVHGGVRDVQQYMTSKALIAQNAAWLREDFPGARVCFFGHSHEQKVYEVDGEAAEISGERIVLNPDKTYFINPGSVDASRKSRHKLAECAILDGDTIEFLRAPYDAAATECKAAAFGYRIPRWVDHAYSLRRRVSRLPQRALAVSSAALRWPSALRSRETN